MSAPPPETFTAMPHLLAEANDRFIGEARQRLHALGFTEIGGNGVVFRWLDPEGSRLAEMVECSGMTKQAFGEHVASLEQHGYLVRAPDPTDGRAKLVVPTERGLACRAAARRIFGEIEDEWAESFGAEDVAAVRRVLQRVADQG